MQTKSLTVTYNDQIVRCFSYATVIWGIVGMLVGVLIALQMAFWQVNVEPYLTFGRLRPLHTNAVIFAFVGNMIFAGVYYSTQRLLKTRMASDLLGKIHFWGWQFIIVAAAITLPLGITQSKEYAELEWPIDYAITFVWVVFAINFFWTLKKRNEKHIYVAIWFYIASIVTIAVLHIVNNLALPVGLGKSYSIFAGVQDALVQWWYGHNAVAFFLTTPILGIMYYFIPKAVNRPVYSYRLSIIHFWALIFLYIWAGPHHLLYSALPDWAQNLGVVFSVALWAPSWGGMINGLLTIRGAWDKLRTDPVVKLFAAAVTFYGMSTFEGPLLSVKSVNALAHSTDWIIGHVHGGALGWNGFMAAGMLYWMVPRLFGTKLYSEKLANFHFWIGLFGILLYVAAMWASGITQGLMWRALTSEGTLLYPNFLEAINKSRIMYMMRLVGGTMYLSAFIVMAYNIFKTIRSGKPVESTVEVTIAKEDEEDISWKRLVFSPTLLVMFVGMAVLLGFVTTDLIHFMLLFVVSVLFVVACFFLFGFKMDQIKGHSWHHVLEGKPLLFTILTLIAILIGGMVQIIPAVTVKDAVPMTAVAKPYTPLQLVGRDIYIREGCNNCHTQMVRPFVAEKLRYGDASESWEYANDHPHLWGSKRTGPDLFRLGGKYPNSWHYNHMIDPRAISAGSIMPAYAALATRKFDPSIISIKVKGLSRLGVQYSDYEIQDAAFLAEQEAKSIQDNLSQDQITTEWDTEMVALIAYLQRLGKHEVVEGAK
ncbi:MAG: cytochrome-c oxidase, cbb3-type subunit I [Bdellovibrionales bacterium]|nr:cytochrome-c oxidase, cbb3-type subunit I [Bdellovibrionales bacterium]